MECLEWVDQGASKECMASQAACPHNSKAWVVAATAVVCCLRQQQQQQLQQPLPRLPPLRLQRSRMLQRQLLLALVLT